MSGWSEVKKKSVKKKDASSKPASGVALYGVTPKKQCKFYAEDPLSCVKGKFCPYSHVARLKVKEKKVAPAIAPVTKEKAAVPLKYQSKSKTRSSFVAPPSSGPTLAEAHGSSSAPFASPEFQVGLIDDDPEREFDPFTHGASAAPRDNESSSFLAAAAPPESLKRSRAQQAMHSISTEQSPAHRTRDVPCRYDAQGEKCPFGEKCRFNHKSEGGGPTGASSPAIDGVCNICLEKVLEKREKFGLLLNCSHCFCLPCITDWRGEAESSTADASVQVTRSCPVCRSFSGFIIPSMIMEKDESRKQRLLEEFLSLRKQKPCRFFSENQSCRFGNSCHFSHQIDGVEVPARSVIDASGESRALQPGLVLSDFLSPSSSTSSTTTTEQEGQGEQLTAEETVVLLTEKELARFNFEENQRH